MQITHIRPATVYLLLLCLFFIAGCESPGQRLSQQAADFGLQTILAPSTETDKPLIAFYQAGKGEHDITLVYIEGDGQPWDKGLWPAKNPNTHHSVVLPLVKQSSRESLYLSRPCYSWETLPPYCNAYFWTSGRYSETVVAMMNSALDNLKARFDQQRYLLVGHSGGGALAMLLAARRNDVAGVITLSGNLDHRAWTHFWAYQPLEHSLNVVDDAILPPHIKRWHLLAGKDQVIPFPLLQQAAQRDPNARIIHYPKLDHQCCWQTLWPEVLEDFLEDNFLGNMPMVLRSRP